MKTVSCRVAFVPLMVVLLGGLMNYTGAAPAPSPPRTPQPTPLEDAPHPKTTGKPTNIATLKPTRAPTVAKPTKAPTTAKVTSSPTIKPTKAPTGAPTVKATKGPTAAPTLPVPPPVAALASTVTATAPLAAGIECEDVPCTGTIYPNATGIPQALDLLLLFDSTGSMSGTIDTAKTQALALLAALRAAGMTNLQSAVADHKDYLNTYVAPGSCGSISGGGVGDYVWNLDQAMTAVDLDVKNAIASLVATGGGDAPEAHLSALYHSYADATVGWRGGSVPKVVVAFSDEIPHTCGSVACPDLVVPTTGLEPGADLIVGTADDLTVDKILAGLQATRTTVFMLGPYVWPIWTCMTAATGGTAELLGTDISAQIVSLVTTSFQSIASLTLEPCTATDSAYLSAVTPALYQNVVHSDLDQHFSFNATVCPPSTATTGAHPVRFCLKGDGPTLAETKVDCDVK